MSEDPREELTALVTAARAWLEVHEGAATYGLPASPPRARVVVAEPPIEARPAIEAPRRSESAPVAARAESAPSPARRLAVVSDADRDARLGAMKIEVAACVKCALHAQRKQTVFARGNPAAELMFVGEGPGADEDAQGLPFVGAAGQLLDKMITAMGFDPSEVYIANVVKCRPPANRKPEPEELSSCVGYLHEQIALVRPKVLVGLGATAMEGLMNLTGIMRLRGTFRLYKGEIPIMPTFHPAYLLRKPEAKRDAWSDLQQVMTKLGRSRT